MRWATAARPGRRPPALGEADHLARHRVLLGGQGVAPQGPEALAERQGEDVGIVHPACEGDRVGGERVRPGRVPLVVVGVGEGTEKSRPLVGGHVVAGGERPLERVDDGTVDLAVRARLPEGGGSERGCRPAHRAEITHRLGDADGVEERLLGTRDVVGEQARPAELQQQLVTGPRVAGPRQVEQAAGVVPVAGGHLERPPPVGGARRPHGVLERLRGDAGRRPGAAVVHEGGQVLVERGRAQRLDGRHDRSVEPGPPCHAQLGRQGVGDEGVGEAQPGRPGQVLGQQAGLDRGVERVEGVGCRDPRRVRQHVELDRQSQHGRRGEELLGLGREHADPPADDVERGARDAGAAGGGDVGEPLLAGEQLDDLADEERVAAGAFVHEARHLVRHRRAAPSAEPGAHLGVGQALQVDALGSRLPGQLGQAGDQRWGRVGSDGAHGGHEQHRHAGQRAGHELERAQRRCVGPLEVVDDEDQRPGGRPQCGDHGAVQCGAVGGRVDRVDAAAGGADVAAGGVTDHPRRHQLLGDLRVAPVGSRRRALLAARPGDGELLGGGRGHERLRQAGLADAGLAADDHHPPGPGRRVAGRLDEPAQLGRAADQSCPLVPPVPLVPPGRPRHRRGHRRVRGRCGDQQRPGRARRVEVRRLGEDVGLELSQLRPRLDTDLLGERAAGLGERPQGIGLAAGPVEGEREVAAKPLLERVRGDGRLERPDQLAAGAQRQLGLEGAVESVGVGGLDPGRGLRHPRLARQLGQQRTVEGERLVVALRRGGVRAGRQRGRRRPAEVVEPREVDDVPVGRESVPARLGDEDDVPPASRPPGLELPAQLGHVGLEGCGGPRGSARTPHVVDEPVRGHRPIEVEQQRGEDRPLLAPAEVGRAAILGIDGEPAEEPVPPCATGGIAHEGPRVPRVVARPCGDIAPPSCRRGHQQPGRGCAHAMTTNEQWPL